MSDSKPSEDDVGWSESYSDDEQTTAGAWKRISCNQVHVHVDNVDALLLEKAREGVECVVGRLLLRMFGTTQHSAANVSISRIVLMWLDSTIMSKLQRFVNDLYNRSLDDDLIRLRSASVDNIGLAHVRNPKKGYGPAQHGVLSLVTGLFLGGHVAARGQSTVDIVRILQRSLCGASTESHIRLPGIVHALDMGYQSIVVNQQITNVRGSIIGTHKCTGRFPFTFGKSPSQYQQLMSEKGERAEHWASKRLPIHTGTSPVHAHALAYRTGPGKVALEYTTMETAGPGYWTYVTSPSSHHHDRHEDDLFSSFEAGVQVLTMSQRAPDWCEKLKCMSREAFLPVSGRKSALVNRLLGVNTAVVPEQNTSAENGRYQIDEALLSAWFMAPFSTQDTKIGSANEENIADHITAFLDKFSEHHVEKLKSYGLLCRRGMPVAAFSPDNIASVLHTWRGRFNAVMEYKTHTTARTVQKEQSLASSHGKFTSVEVTTTGFGGSLSTSAHEAHDTNSHRALESYQGWHRCQLTIFEKREAKTFSVVSDCNSLASNTNVAGLQCTPVVLDATVPFILDEQIALLFLQGLPKT
ncbi:hypothetical protein ON010_g2356 [Phytophthora cinnamomi]|nr:hypothetical protein ON010_g2356 [Phytophthora cinnamomi]